MKLSLSEAATVLGRSERQIRYLIKTGRLRAGKDGGQWRIESADLPLTEAQRRSLADRLGQAREAFDKSVEAVTKVAGEEERRRYSVVDLAAFQAGAALYRELRNELAEDDPACRCLSSALTAVVCGFHNYQPSDKARRFSEARESAASAVASLLLRGGKHQALGERVEQELIPRLSGLVASSERRAKSSRFESFGSAVFRAGPAR